MKQFEKIFIKLIEEKLQSGLFGQQKRTAFVRWPFYAVDDADSLHVSMADEAVLLSGKTLSETYLNQDKIIEIALNSGADAIHPGYGFLSENAVFAQKVADAGLVFIGPDS